MRLISAFLLVLAQSLCICAVAQDTMTSPTQNGVYNAPRKNPLIPSKILPVPVFAKSEVGVQKLQLPGPNDTSLWFRNYKAAEDALNKNDKDVAKRYLLNSLAEFEKHPPHKDMFMLIKLSALEKNLLDFYPADKKLESTDKDELLRQKKEQMDMYYRIARINERYASPSDKFRTFADQRYMTAKAEYEKLVQSETGRKPSSR